MTVLCHKRIPIEGAPMAETYCMKPAGHEGKCEEFMAGKIDHRPLRVQAEEVYGVRKG